MALLGTRAQCVVGKMVPVCGNIRKTSPVGGTVGKMRPVCGTVEKTSPVCGNVGKTNL